MRVSIIVGPRGVDRVVSIGPGLQPTKESLFFLDSIWDEVQDFHRAVVRRFRPPRDDKSGGSEDRASGVVD